MSIPTTCYLQCVSNKGYRSYEAHSLYSTVQRSQCLFMIELSGGTSYSIRNMANGGYLQDSISSYTDKVKGDGQRWNIIPIPNSSSFYIQNISNQGYLTNRVTHLASGTPTVDEEYNLVPITPPVQIDFKGVYFLKCKINSGYRYDRATHLQLDIDFSCGFTISKFTSINDYTYSIQNLKNGGYLRNTIGNMASSATNISEAWMLWPVDGVKNGYYLQNMDNWGNMTSAASQLTINQTQSEIYIIGDTVDCWMQDNLSLLGTKTIKDICIPGSHDSGMYKVVNGTLGADQCNTQTQSFDIFNQLKLGIRYFDIRPIIGASQYHTGHYTDKTPGNIWMGARGGSISEIIQDINNFTASRQELIILNLSHSLNTDNKPGTIIPEYTPFDTAEWNGLFAQISTINDLFQLPSNTPLTALTLDTFILSGKSAVVIIIEEFEQQNNQLTGTVYDGKGFYYKEAFSPLNKYYGITGNNDLNGMITYELDLMKTNQQASYFLLSWTLTQIGNEAAKCIVSLSPSIRDLADTANETLNSQLLPVVSSSNFPNIIYIDNVVSDMVTTCAIEVNKVINS
ncbi:MAG: hypothetical protein ACI9YE_002562 [Psychroserpens sp.]|jgi:hypothetical protein